MASRMVIAIGVTLCCFLVSVVRKWKMIPFGYSIIIIVCFMIFRGFCNFWTCFYRLVFGKKTQVCNDRGGGWSHDYSSNSDDCGTEEITDNTRIRQFKISISNEVLGDLQERLGRTRFEDPIEDSRFMYGLNPTYLRTVTEYWRNQYHWRTQEKKLNEYPQFRTTIEGLDVHFLYVKAELTSGLEMKVHPLLMLHGWPGSCADFLKVIPLLTKPCTNRKFAFDIVCPSVPGCGFSQSPRRKGFDAGAAASMFVTLMNRLGYSRFFVQGYGWGAVIASVMARYYPSRVSGLHVNSYFSPPTSLDATIRLLLIAAFPFLVSSSESRMVLPLTKKLWNHYKGNGFFHFQSTRPDTLGCALSNNPAGMAAYIMDTFSTATNPNSADLADGGLSEKFRLDELLTIVMLCWINKNFTSGARFSRETMKNLYSHTHDEVPLTVPCGVAVFPNESIMLPKFVISQQVEDLVSYNIMPRGGHFAVIEEPQLLADDIWNFVELVETRTSTDALHSAIEASYTRK